MRTCLQPRATMPPSFSETSVYSSKVSAIGPKGISSSSTTYLQYDFSSSSAFEKPHVDHVSKASHLRCDSQSMIDCVLHSFPVIKPWLVFLSRYECTLQVFFSELLMNDNYLVAFCLDLHPMATSMSEVSYAGGKFDATSSKSRIWSGKWQLT